MRLTDFTHVMPTDNEPRRRIVLVGMLEDGPLAQGFVWNLEKPVHSLLGDNALTRSYQFLVDGGANPENIVFYRINGKHSRLSLQSNGKDFFQFVSIGANDQDNNLSLTVSEEGITLYSQYAYDEEDVSLANAQAETRPNFKRTYLFEEHPYLSDLSAAINQDASLGLVDVAAREVEQGISSLYFSENGEYLFENGASEANLTTRDLELPDSYAEDYWQQFHQYVLGKEFDGMSYSDLMEIKAELLYFPDMAIDENPEIGLFAARISEQKTREQGILCSALFRTSPVPGKTDIEENEYFVSDTHYFNAELQTEVEYKPFAERDAFIEKLLNLYTTEDRLFDYMENLQILVGEDVDADGIVRPGALHYANLLLTAPFYKTMSNKTLEQFAEINSELPKSLIATLQAKGYICIVPSVRRKAVCLQVQDVAEGSRTGLNNHHNKRLLTYIAYDVEQLLEQYIGNTTYYYASSSVVKLLTEYLEQYKLNNIIQSYYIEAGESPSLEAEQLDITLYFYNEVTSVRNQITVSKEGWEIDLWNTIDNSSNNLA